MTTRENTRAVSVGGVKIGGGAPISVQSMTNTRTSNAEATLSQIRALAGAGCDIVRVTVNDDAAADALPSLIKGSPVPLVACIHFSGKLALRAVEAGIHKLRINPGNLPAAYIDSVVASCRERSIPIRIGVNGGSLPRDLLQKYGGATARAMAEAALRHVQLLEERGFFDIIISVKTSDAPRTVAAYELLAEACAYPLHLGVTEAGVGETAVIKNAIGIGSLLLRGIGDTLRVSLAGDPLPEAEAGYSILASCGLLPNRPEVIACPTCGRCGYDVAAVATQVRDAVKHLRKPLRIAVMGCVVNGPGEARDCDIGVAGGEDGAALFIKGKPPRRIPFEGMAQLLIDEIFTLP